MAALSGYNPSISLLPASGGTIQAMSGGGMNMPPAGFDPSRTLLPASGGEISSYKGGFFQEPIYIGGVPDTDVAMGAAVNELDKKVAIQAAVAAHKSRATRKSASSAPPGPVGTSSSIDTSSTTGTVGATGATGPSGPSNTSSPSGATGSSKSNTSDTTDKDDSNTGPKDIILFGKPHVLENPSKRTGTEFTEQQIEALTLFGLDGPGITDKEKQDILQALYDGKCNSDKPLGMLVNCEPVRRIVQSLALNLLSKIQPEDGKSANASISKEEMPEVRFDKMGDGSMKVCITFKPGSLSLLSKFKPATGKTNNKGTSATGTNAGTNASATGTNVGTNASATGTNVGTNAVVTGTNAGATGTNAGATGTNAGATGTNGNATGTNGNATGTNVGATGTNGNATGTNGNATGTNATGLNASGLNATGTNGNANGANVGATGLNATGTNGNPTGLNATGANVNASGLNATGATGPNENDSNENNESVVGPTGPNEIIPSVNKTKKQSLIDRFFSAMRKLISRSPKGSKQVPVEIELQTFREKVNNSPVVIPPGTLTLITDYFEDISEDDEEFVKDLITALEKKSGEKLSLSDRKKLVSYFKDVQLIKLDKHKGYELNNEATSNIANVFKQHPEINIGTSVANSATIKPLILDILNRLKTRRDTELNALMAALGELPEEGLEELEEIASASGTPVAPVAGPTGPNVINSPVVGPTGPNAAALEAAVEELNKKNKPANTPADKIYKKQNITIFGQKLNALQRNLEEKQRGPGRTSNRGKRIESIKSNKQTLKTKTGMSSNVIRNSLSKIKDKYANVNTKKRLSFGGGKKKTFKKANLNKKRRTMKKQRK